MRIKMLRPYKEIEKALEKIGVANLNKRVIHTSCNLVKLDGDAKVIHFKEMMQIHEKRYNDMFINDYVDMFDGYCDNELEPYQIQALPEFMKQFVNGSKISILVSNNEESVSVDDYDEFITDIGSEAFKHSNGVQTNSIKRMLEIIWNYIDVAKEAEKEIVKEDLKKYIEDNYISVVDFTLSDQLSKKRYLSALYDLGFICMVDDVDFTDIPPFQLMFDVDGNVTEVYNETVTIDTNSVFLNLNLEEDLEKYGRKGERFDYAPHYNDVIVEGYITKRKINVPRKYRF